MNKLKFISILAIVIGFASCVPMTYFTEATRKTMDHDSIDLTKIQFYVDRDLELRREVSSGEAKVSSGVVKYENGKYVHIILLKRNTPGVCVATHSNSLDICFETGDGKKLVFGISGTNPDEIYRIFAKEWVNTDGGKIGKITYNNETYYIQPGGEGARLCIKKSAVQKYRADVQTMNGVKVKE